MTTLKQYRIQARVSISQLARRADVSPSTVSRAEDGNPVQELKAIQIAQALSEFLGRVIRVEDIEDLNVYQ